MKCSRSLEYDHLSFFDTIQKHHAQLNKLQVIITTNDQFGLSLLQNFALQTVMTFLAAPVEVPESSLDTGWSLVCGSRSKCLRNLDLDVSVWRSWNTCVRMILQCGADRPSFPMQSCNQSFSYRAAHFASRPISSWIRWWNYWQFPSRFYHDCLSVCCLLCWCHFHMCGQWDQIWALQYVVGMKADVPISSTSSCFTFSRHRASISVRAWRRQTLSANFLSKQPKDAWRSDFIDCRNWISSWFLISCSAFTGHRGNVVFNLSSIAFTLLRDASEDHWFTGIARIFAFSSRRLIILSQAFHFAIIGMFAFL